MKKTLVIAASAFLIASCGKPEEKTEYTLEYYPQADLLESLVDNPSFVDSGEHQVLIFSSITDSRENSGFSPMTGYVVYVKLKDSIQEDLTYQLSDTSLVQYYAEYIGGCIITRTYAAGAFNVDIMDSNTIAANVTTQFEELMTVNGPGPWEAPVIIPEMTLISE